MLELAPGQVLQGLKGRYRVEGRHREGGFGVTFVAWDEASGVKLMLKQLRFERMGDWKTLELFLREGRVLEALSHPSIPAYRDFFAHDGQQPFEAGRLHDYAGPGKLSLVLVQRWVEGPTLEERVQQGPLSPAELDAVLGSLLDTLTYLHDRTPPVVHRDISPRNVILPPHGRPHLVDFGAIQDQLRSASTLGSTMVGTLGFMPLEQLRGDARPSSDLYALAMTMLFAASGMTPSQMPVDERTGKVQVSQIAPSLSAGASIALSRMAEPIVGQRISTAHAALDLLRHLQQVPPPQQESSGSSRGLGVAVLVGVAAVGALVTLVFAGGFLFFGIAVPRSGAITGAGPTPLPPAIVAPVLEAPEAPEAIEAPSAEAPPVGLTSPREASLTFSGRVRTTQGAGASVGSPCSLTVRVQSDGERVTAMRDVRLVCGGKTLYDSGASFSGISNTSWGIDEVPVAGKVSNFVYALAYSDVGSRTGARTQITIDSTHAQAVVFSEIVPTFRVEVSLDTVSRERADEALLRTSEPVFSKVIKRQAKVLKTTGTAPVRAGSVCEVVLSPAHREGLQCRALVRCGGKTLYGDAMQGFGACSVVDDAPELFSDVERSAQSGDPSLVIELKDGVAQLSDTTSAGDYSVSFALTP